jgi:hypothetical protein
MNLKTISHFDERRLGTFCVCFVIVHYEFGYLHIFSALRMSRLPNFTGMSAILQPYATRFYTLFAEHSVKIQDVRIKTLNSVLFEDKNMSEKYTVNQAVIIAKKI